MVCTPPTEETTEGTSRLNTSVKGTTGAADRSPSALSARNEHGVEAIYLKPPCFKVETRATLNLVLPRGQDQRHVIRPNAPFRHQRTHGKEHFPIEGHKDTIEYTTYRGELFVCPRKSSTSPSNFPQGTGRDRIIEQGHSMPVYVAVVLIRSRADKVKIAPRTMGILAACLAPTRLWISPKKLAARE